jgi:hypothetical protein
MKPFPRMTNQSIRRYCSRIGFCLLLTTHGLFAQVRPTENETQAVARAREYFRAGAQAYSIGEYAAAIQAFEQAYTLAPRPAVLFSIAQAEKRQYYANHETNHLEKAIVLYRQYLDAEPQAARKADAIQALSELEPLLPPKPPEPSRTVPSRLDEPKPTAPTRLMLSSPAEGVTLSLDGATPQSSPLIREVQPGKHVVRISAPGYVTDERQVVAIEGALVTFDIALTAEPAKLLVVARDGAALTIDGRLQGTCPFPKPLELTPGDHLITLTEHGYETWSAEQHLSRGKTTTVVARMSRTTLHTTSLILFGAAASAMTAVIPLSIFTVEQESSANAFLRARGKRTLNPADLADYNSIRSDRDRLRFATLTTAGVGVGLAALGAFLFVYDTQSPANPLPKQTAQRSIGFGASREQTLPFVKATPELGPGFPGLNLSGAF